MFLSTLIRDVDKSKKVFQSHPPPPPTTTTTKKTSPESYSKEKETRNYVFLGPYTYQGLREV